MTRFSTIALAAALAAALSLPLSAQTYDDARAAYDAGDFARAAELMMPLVDAGDAEAMNLLALMYDDGLGGLPVDPTRALELYTRSADLGFNGGQHNLARVYHHGLLGQAVDLPRAQGLYELAVAAGNEFAMNSYALMQEQGHLGPQNWTAIVDLYTRAANADEPNAAANLANMYLNGRDGFPDDPILARQWAERTVAVGSARGMRMLGYMLEFSVGGPEDVPRAESLYLQAWDLGDAAAANDMALLFNYGATGVPVNLRRAAEWYERGISAGDEWSHVNLADLLVDGDQTVPDDAVRARALYEIGHDMGNLDASVSLSYLHWDGVGGPVDYPEARRLLTHAAEQNDLGAINDLGVMLQQGLGGVIDIAGAAHLYQRAAEGGHTLGAQNLAYILTDTTKSPVDPVEGVAWCHFSAEREENPQTRAEYRENCIDLAGELSAADRGAAIARSAQLLQTH